jgi:hypothetical protein
MGTVISRTFGHPQTVYPFDLRRMAMRDNSTARLPVILAKARTERAGYSIAKARQASLMKCTDFGRLRSSERHLISAMESGK